MAGARTEGRGELLITAAMIAEPAVITVTVTSSILAQVESVAQGLLPLPTEPVFKHVMALSIV